MWAEMRNVYSAKTSAMTLGEFFDIFKVFILVRYMCRCTPVRQLATIFNMQTHCIPCGFTTNSDDHKALSKLLGHNLQKIPGMM